MMESLFHKHFNAFKDRSEEINKVHIDEVKLVNREWLTKKVDSIDSNVETILCLKYQSILDSLVYVNSFIGNEFMYLKYVMHQLCIWNAIAIDRSPNESESNICKTEIQLLFYTMINLVYNLKEKLSDLCSVSKGKAKQESTIINRKAQDELLGVFFNEYQYISEYCLARKWLVHRSYSILYMKEMESVRFYYTELDFSTNRLDKGRKEIMDFSIQQEDLIKPLMALYRSITSVLQILSNLENIDPEKLIDKFRTSINGKPRIQISL